MIYYSYKKHSDFHVKILDEIADKYKVEAINNNYYDGVLLTILFLERFNAIGDILSMNSITNDKLELLMMKPINKGFKFYISKEFFKNNFIKHVKQDPIKKYDDLESLLQND